MKVNQLPGRSATIGSLIAISEGVVLLFGTKRAFLIGYRLLGRRPSLGGGDSSETDVFISFSFRGDYRAVMTWITPARGKRN